MLNTTLYIIISVIIVSLISFIGAIALTINIKKLNKILIYLVSFAAGALLGDTFLHLIPEISKNSGLTPNSSFLILAGVGVFFVLEKFAHWQHCHAHMTEENHIHPFAYINLIGDGLHNFIDGLIIAASYLISIPVGIATTTAVALHEIPQEIGDLGVLLHGGFTKGKAILINFLSAIVSIAGAILIIFLGNIIENIQLILIPIAAGSFIYIAGSDLIPELHKETRPAKSFLQLIALIIGVAIMFFLTFLE